MLISLVSVFWGSDVVGGIAKIRIIQKFFLCHVSRVTDMGGRGGKWRESRRSKGGREGEREQGEEGGVREKGSFVVGLELLTLNVHTQRGLQ